MSSNYEPIRPSPSGGVKFRTIILLLLIAFIGGIISAGWAITRYDIFQTGNSAPSIVMDRNIIKESGTADSETKPSQSAELARTAANQKTAIDNQSIREPINNLGESLPPNDTRSQQASATVDRAESMLIAISARRAVDSGSALGYLEHELRLKFGNSNPDDVRAITDASNNPVRLATLQNQLDSASDILLSPSNDATIWDVIKKEMGELFVIRKAGSQPPQADRRLARIKTALANRDIETAILEMEKMPGAGSARDWIALAKRYMRVQQALDAIEKTALSIPSNILPTIQPPAAVQEAQRSIETVPAAPANQRN